MMTPEDYDKLIIYNQYLAEEAIYKEKNHLSLFLHLHTNVLAVCLHTFPCCKDTCHIGFGTTLMTFNLITSANCRPCLQKWSHSEIVGVRTGTQIFGGERIQCTAIAKAILKIIKYE